MGFGETLVSICGVLAVFGSPVLVVQAILRHKQRMRELDRGLSPASDSNLRLEVETLRQELRRLRDTTSQYDVSFDTALQNMERKYETLDRKLESNQRQYDHEIRVSR